MAEARRSPRETLAGLDGLLVRDAGNEDALQGVRPAIVVTPASVAHVSAVLRSAHAGGLCVVPRGGGSKLSWADPPRSLDIVLDLGGLRGIVDHAAGDMVVVARAGTRLQELQDSLASSRQWLALDPPEPGATLGGVVAANAAGPRQLLYGRPRDLLIGIEVVLPDGTVARSGGRVVKNVAGYDLGKLYAGSLGTLGVIVETTFRLHPKPAAAETIAFELIDDHAVERAVSRIAGSQWEPSFVTIGWSPKSAARLLVELAGSAAGARERATELELQLVGLGGVRALASEKRAAGGADCVLRLGFRQTDLVRILAELRRVSEETGVDCRAECQALAGIADVDLQGPESALARVVEQLRGRLGDDANVLLRQASPSLKRSHGSFGRLGSPSRLLQSVKREFDPSGVLSPGRVPWA